MLVRLGPSMARQSAIFCSALYSQAFLAMTGDPGSDLDCKMLEGGRACATATLAHWATSVVVWEICSGWESRCAFAALGR
mmetsp:Transcript_96795/g.211692  ORF Transcript_96795/g.211692 Transcript_96795/m.211692 type:complete len:80 (+) Transcript_96795:75-314(+)